jgi:hypothetical protein
VAKLPSSGLDLVAADERLLVLLYRHPAEFPSVAGYDLEGGLDPTWGERGYAEVSRGIGSIGALGGPVALLRDGDATLAAIAEGGELNVTRLDGSGRPDASFGGADGVTAKVLQTRGFHAFPDAAVTRRPDGSFVFAGAVSAGDARASWLLAAVGGPRLAPVAGFGERLPLDVTLQARRRKDRVWVTVRASALAIVTLTMAIDRRPVKRRVAVAPGRARVVRLRAAGAVRITGAGVDALGERSPAVSASVPPRRSRARRL